MTITITPEGPTLADVIAVARHGHNVELSESALDKMRQSRTIIDDIEQQGKPVYGVSTGFGALANTLIGESDRARMQKSLVRSHAAGVDDPMDAEVVRAMILLRIRSLAKGYSGVRPVIAQQLADLLNSGIVPWVPRHGSLGASGDLAPLAHCAMVAMGEGWINHDGKRVDAAAALAEAGIEPVELSAKEGIALINGTDGMLAMLILAVDDLNHFSTVADVTAALSIEAMLGTDRPFAPELHAIRPQPGQGKSAANLYKLLQHSAIMDSHRDDFEHAVQDAYSMRCAPQVSGAARDVVDYARQVSLHELESIVDNPVVLRDGRVESTGNFHGAPLAYALDFLAIAATDMGSIAERRVDRLLDATRNRELPAFLTPEPGVNSGLMIAQYTAAGIVAENRRLANPASVDSIPTSGMQEDHVSMGWSAGYKLRTVVTNLANLLAVEFLSASRGLQLRAPLTPSPSGHIAIDIIEEIAGQPGDDLFTAPIIEAVAERLSDRRFIDDIAAKVGELH
ncbi:histidine ammonia-lyase [Haloglycomyces albus]|uniref:histidine ammonia-lyase n=1 Tax=Haloglycomyces albus TaxID=526067 RepID=UPI00046D2D6E|nr:histidine ammonia-lyase [Haloglycomyces albus]